MNRLRQTTYVPLQTVGRSLQGCEAGLSRWLRRGVVLSVAQPLNSITNS